MRKAFSFDATTFSDPLGLFVTYNFMFGVLLGGIFSGVLGAKVLHKEQALGTAEFLLAKPLSRVQIAFTKLFACVSIVTVFSILVTLGGYALLSLFATRPFSVGAYWIISTYSFLFSLGMAGLGFLVSLLAKRSKSMAGPAAGMVLGLYLLDMVAKISDQISAIGWISPFKWIDIEVLRPGYSFEWERALAFLVLALLGFGLGTIVYRRKDILS
jgi:ABC-2 type transport system permease protein